ncbi:MAG: Trm112 family protein [Pseudomonadota bacterium]
MAGLNPKLLDVLVCPFTKAPLVLSDDEAWLLSHKAGVAFPVHDGVPILCADAARPFFEDEEDGANRGAP